MSKSILIRDIQVNGANAQSAWWLVSGVSPLAWLGLARSMSIRLNGLANSEQVRVSIIHHDIAMRGNVFYGDITLHQPRGGAFTTRRNGMSSDYPAQAPQSLSEQPIALCNLRASLVIHGIPDVTEAAITDFIQEARVAGGQIQEFGNIQIAEWDVLKKQLPRGYAIAERRDLDQVPAADRLGWMLHKLWEKKEVDSPDSWLSPMCLGYLALTKRERRHGARLGLPHAYAEPLVGMVQYLSIGKLQQEQKNIPIWRYANPERDVFVATAV